MKKKKPTPKPPKPPETKQLEKIFSSILNSKVTVDLDDSNTEKEVFIDVIEILEPLIENEDKVFNLGFDLTSIVKPYILIIEVLLKVHFGEVAYDLIDWYLFKRKDRYGNINVFTDNAGKEFPVENPEDLWNLIQKIGFQ